MKELIIKFLAKSLNKSEEQVAALLYKKAEDGEGLTEDLQDNALDILLGLDADRVAALKGDIDKTKIFDEAHKKATKEQREKLEKAIVKKYGVEQQDGQDFLALVDLAISSAVESAEPGDGKVTDETVKKHPLYLALEKSLQEQVDALTETHNTELEKIKSYAILLLH